MLLEYEPTITRIPTGSLNVYRLNESCREKLNLEQIGDFVRKLGFVDKDNEKGGNNIKHFLHLNKVSCIIMCRINNYYNIYHFHPTLTTDC